MRRLPPHLPRGGPSSRAGRNWHLPAAHVVLRQAAVAGASPGRVPLPLWMSGTRATVPRSREWPGARSGWARGHADHLHRPRRHDGRPAGIVLAHRRPAADRGAGHGAPRAAPGRGPAGAGQRPDARPAPRGHPAAGRRRRDRRAGGAGQLGRRPGDPDAARGDARRLRRPGAARGDDRARRRRAAVRRAPRQLEWHAPWHATHTADAMLRGRVDPLSVDAWLAAQGVGWLTLKDNGALPVSSRMTLAPDPAPPRVYHLMPRGISKGLAVAWDLRRRGIDPADAVAIGDSASDLDMAPAVGRLWITANGAAVDGMAALLADVPNAAVTGGAMGEGWAQAVRASL